MFESRKLSPHFGLSVSATQRSDCTADERWGRNSDKSCRGFSKNTSFTRVAVAGGDTSGYVARELGITALEAIAPVAPGSPLCRVHADNELNGIEIFFKGGQVGKDNVWETMLKGTT